MNESVPRHSGPNPSVTKNGPVVIDGHPLVVEGTTFHYQGHYVDRVDLDGNRLVWEWYDIIPDGKKLPVCRIASDTSDEDIAALIRRVYRLYIPEGFAFECRWLWDSDASEVVEDFEDSRIVRMSPPSKTGESPPAAITIPDGLIESENFLPGDEVTAYAYVGDEYGKDDVGDETDDSILWAGCLHRRFVIPPTPGPYVIPLDEFEQYRDDVEKDYPGLPVLGDTVTISIEYTPGYGYRELSDTPRYSELDEPLNDIHNAVEEYADIVLRGVNAAIRKTRMSPFDHLLDRANNDKNTRLLARLLIKCIRKEIEGTPLDDGGRERDELLLQLLSERLSKPPEILDAAYLDGCLEASRQLPAESPRSERWSEMVGEWIQNRKSFENTATGKKRCKTGGPALRMKYVPVEEAPGRDYSDYLIEYITNDVAE